MKKIGKTVSQELDLKNWSFDMFNSSFDLATLTFQKLSDISVWDQMYKYDYVLHSA